MILGDYYKQFDKFTKLVQASLFIQVLLLFVKWWLVLNKLEKKFHLLDWDLIRVVKLNVFEHGLEGLLVIFIVIQL